MRQVSREVSISYNGETYCFTPSNKLMRRIDAGLAPQTVLGVIGVMEAKEVPLPALAYIICEMLNEGGGKFDEDEVWADLHDDMVHNGAKGIGSLVQSIAECITPVRQEEKNLRTPARKTGGKKR